MKNKIFYCVMIGLTVLNFICFYLSYRQQCRIVAFQFFQNAVVELPLAVHFGKIGETAKIGSLKRPTFSPASDVLQNLKYVQEFGVLRYFNFLEEFCFDLKRKGGFDAFYYDVIELHSLYNKNAKNDLIDKIIFNVNGDYSSIISILEKVRNKENL